MQFVITLNNMKLFGYWTVLVALSISAVAAYYSIVGLVAIFASAVIPIIIMGSVLEVGKLTSAVWLHLNWKAAPILIKTYLTVAVVLLMFITSMGIFGFLSKAHIEQTSMATENVAQIERIDEGIVRNKVIITKAEAKVIKLEEVDSSLDDGIQDKINIEQERINTAYSGVQPSIDEQNVIIVAEADAKASAIAPYMADIANIDKKLTLLDEYSINGEITKMQGLIGVAQDGRIGYNTREALKKFKEDNTKAKMMATYMLNKVRTEFNSSVTESAREEIKRIRMIAEQQITDSNELISRLRSQLGQGQQEDNSALIVTQRNLILTAETKLDELYNTKFTLEGVSRQLEAEVGPVKYIAELVYGSDPTRSTLEETVRYVILILVVVFDPLAIALVIAGISQLVRTAPNKRVPPVTPTPAPVIVTPKPKDTYERPKPKKSKNGKSPINVSSTKKDDMGTKEVKEIAKEPIIQNEVPAEEVIHVDEDNREYTIDATGKKNYLLDDGQWELNKMSASVQKKEKKEVVNKIVDQIRGNSMLDNNVNSEGILKKKIEEIFENEHSQEMQDLLAKVDDSILTDIYTQLNIENNK